MMNKAAALISAAALAASTLLIPAASVASPTPTTPSWVTEGYDGSDSSLAAWDCAHGRTPSGYGIDGTALEQCTARLSADDVPAVVFDWARDHGAPSDATDHCECLYVPVGSVFGPADQQWTVTADSGAEPVGAN